MSTFKIFRYKVRFLTPAFIGDADKSGLWRVPPFKEQLRYWWRVVYASHCNFNFDVAEMRRAEGMLLGNAWLQEGATKSLVQIRLSKWERGTLRSWNGLEGADIFHPEVTYPQYVHRQNYTIGPQAYLGYGPLDGRGGTRFGKGVEAAINANEEAMLSLRFPCSHYNAMQHILFLMNRFGSIGGRSRNGWGAYELIPKDDTPEFNNDLSQFLRNWRNALQLDWPHAIGQDERGPLVWFTESKKRWQDVIRDLAIIKVGVRTQFVFSFDEDAGDEKKGKKITHAQPQSRHWLAYPVTNHNVDSWGRESRLPNTLRFTVKRTHSNQLKGLIFHIPCRPPNDFSPNMNTLVSVWQKVHQLLDELTKPVVQRRYAMIDDVQRRNQLRPELDKITLYRGQGG